MSLSRFYLPPESWPDDGQTHPVLTLAGDEAQHCSRVLRRQAGDSVELFDGEGRVAVAEITSINKSSVVVQAQSVTRVAPARTAIHLLVALIKAEPFEWLIEKAVELGAASVRPMLTEHTVVQLDGAQLEKKMQRWRRHMIESAKQCHTPFVPALHEPAPLREVMGRCPTLALKFIAALMEHTRQIAPALGGAPPHEVFLAIGPEGDFTPDELDAAAEQGFQSISLGPLILRAETAAIAGLAILAHEARRAWE